MPYRNPDLRKANGKRYYLENRDRILRARSAYVAANKEKCRALDRKRYQKIGSSKAYKDAQKARHASRYSRPDYRQKILARNTAYNKVHPEKAVAQMAKRRAQQLNSCVNPISILTFIRGVRSKAAVACYYCGSTVPGKCAHFDHVIALSRGGAHSVENLCVSCAHCNQSKNDSLIQDWFRLGQQILSL